MDKDNINNKINDCKGTCKTITGCTCKDIEEGSETAIESKSSLLKTNTSATTCGGCCKKKRLYGSNKLDVYNYLDKFPKMYMDINLVEVQFKNTRKEYFNNSNNLEIYKGDIVVVEASPGSDIGEVTLTGKLVELQMKKANYKNDVKRIYRTAKLADIEKYELAKAKEHRTMLRAREIAEELEIDMKISDVEFQGDGNKAIFYYIADGRVDFRQLIKHYASEFKIKIEMKQIGARQEAGRVGGIGPCGRELCCSSSMSNFVSVTTGAARIQDIPINPQKMTGQCGKLKCCMNFEVDVYVEAQKSIPPHSMELYTADSTYYFFKADILKGMVAYSTAKNFPANLVTIEAKRAFDIMRMNKKGQKPDTLDVKEELKENTKPKSVDLLETESITRFDSKNGNKKNKKRNNKSFPRNKEGENEALITDSVENNNDSSNSNSNNTNKRIDKRPRNLNNKNPNTPKQETTEKKQFVDKPTNGKKKLNKRINTDENQ